MTISPQLPESIPVGDISTDTLSLARQARQTVGVLQTSEYVVLQVTGVDAASFLQNRLSNNVIQLKPGQGQLNSALDRHGKIEGLFCLHYVEPNHYFLVIEAAAAESARAGILKYRIMEQVDISDIASSPAVLVCQGAKSTDALQRLNLLSDAMVRNKRDWDVQTLPLGDVTVLRHDLTGSSGYLLLTDDSNAEPLLSALTQSAEELGGGLITADALGTMRIEAGHPQFGRDYGNHTVLPETGLERQAVDYDKGCFLGQETVAKIRTYGGVPRLLSGLLFSVDSGDQDHKATLPPSGEAILLNGKDIGHLKSITVSPAFNQPVAIASLGRAERVPGKTLQVTVADQPYTVTIRTLPMLEANKKDADTSDNTKSTNANDAAQRLLDDGLGAFAENRDADAMTLLRRAIEANPRLEGAYEALGVILARQDEPESYQEAITLMNQVLELNPDHVLAHTNLSVYYMRLGDKDKAEAEKGLATMASFRAAMKEKGVAPVVESPAQQAQRLAEEKARKDAGLREKVALFEQALHYSPEDPLGNFGLGSTLLELERFEEAVEPFRKTLKAQPKHSMAYVSLGKALEALDRNAEALEAYHTGIDVAAARGDLMPLQTMQARVAELEQHR